MHKIEELREMLMEELEKCASKGELSAGSLEVIDKLAHAIKSIDVILAMEEEGGYSNEGGSSGARGRGRNAIRDSRGRYSSRGGSYENMSYEGGGMSSEGGSYGGGSYGGSYEGGGSYGGSYGRGGRGGGRSSGYSRDEAKDELVNQLKEIAMDTQDEESKRMIHKWIKQVEQG